MKRPFYKTFKPLLNNAIKVVLFFALFFTISLFSSSEVKATEKCYYTKANADVKCKCRKDQCRLSSFGAMPLLGTGTSGNPIADSATDIVSSKVGAYVYDCFDSNTGAVVDIKSAPYSQYSVSNYVQNLQLKTDQSDGGSFAPLVMDEFSNNINKKFVVANPVEPQYSSVCKSADGVAYWYYQGYFKDVMKGGSGSVGAFCSKPILVDRDLFGKTVNGTETSFGCLPNSINGVTAFILRLGLGIATLVGVLIILINLIKMVTSSTNPEAVAEARKKMISGIFTLLGLYLGLTILSIAGLQILDLGSFGGGLIKIFTGG